MVDVSTATAFDADFPAPGSAEERGRFEEIQARMASVYEGVISGPRAPRTMVVVPSLSLDEDELAKVSGAHHYEERMLCMLMLLRLPRGRLIFVTSQQTAEPIIDYYLHLLPGIPHRHARQRLTLLSCHDSSSAPLTQKILDRPRLVKRIRDAILDPRNAYITCFNATSLEQTLAVRLGVPLYACDPALNHLGTKSGGREVFREAGVPMPDGVENLREERDIAEALAGLKRRHPDLRSAVVKLNEGFSGEGNAIFRYEGAPSEAGGDLSGWVRAELPRRLRFEADSESWEHYLRKFAEMGGIVESFVEGGEEIRSPSVQCRIDPLGRASIISTHDQMLGGPSGQVFLGSTFPADPEYSKDIQEMGWRVAEVLLRRGALGRFAIDFISVRREGSPGWDHYAIEINLRKGGTTHPYMMLQFLTNGKYDPKSGLYRTPTGQTCHYFASDNLESPAYKGLTPDDLIDISVENGLHFDGASQQGVMFHLIGALSEYGKVGTVCVGDSRESAEKFYGDTVTVLDREARQ